VRLSDFDYHLPEHLVAQHPREQRSGARLLDARGQQLMDRAIQDLPGLFQAGDLMIFNDTKVIKARLAARRDTGGAAEVMIEQLLDEHHAQAMLRVSHAPRAGSTLCLSDGSTLTVLERSGEFYRLESDEPWMHLLERLGSLPLPPYISHAPSSEDEARYQTVYARHAGAVAAPTAGLHFDPELLRQIDARGVTRATLTLHVGAGTFLPMRHDDVSQHVMHSERYQIPAELCDLVAATRQNHGRVIAVGTTSLRALESAANDEGVLASGAASTRLFITPGYRFKVVDTLMTNFHLPRSTLLMLVSAFAGSDLIRRAYAHAIACEYRFFSYGDAMLLDRNEI
jgi:S-adenosylmethionine:tRNA ribosyltransferase-isomerase